jgi:hypothetical protein
MFWSMRRTSLCCLVLVLAGAASERGGDLLPSARQPEPQALDVPAQIALGVTVEPSRWLKPLVEHLVAGTESELSHRIAPAPEAQSVRAKAIHDWIALNIEYSAEDSVGETLSGDFATALVTGRSACAGYSNLFAAMCSLAGIECRTVVGYTRSQGMDVFSEEDPFRVNHAWNAVKLAGEWRLVDPTWDAGRLRDGVFEKAYSTDYLFSGPRMFSHTHFPSDPQWQLRSRPLTAEEFTRQPSLRAEFLALGLSLVDGLHRVNVVDGPAVIDLNVPQEVSVYAKVLDREGNVLVARVQPDRRHGRAKFELRLPRGAERVIAVYASPAGLGSRHVATAFFGFSRSE